MFTKNISITNYTVQTMQNHLSETNNTGFLFSEIVFGPIKSRRLKISLGVNLLPTTIKYCSFDCIYCECGWSLPRSYSSIVFPSSQKVYEALDKKLSEMKNNNDPLDSITFAGNGEPTTHPHFLEIINQTIELRNKYYPEAKVTVLSNATMAYKENVISALKLIDNNILKLDAGSDEMFHTINGTNNKFKIQKIVDNIKNFDNNVIIQTIFFRGTYKGKEVDNTTDHEIKLWLDYIKEINPKEVMIYTLDRKTPVETLLKADAEKLNEIADKVRQLGIEAKVYE